MGLWDTKYVALKRWRLGRWRLKFDWRSSDNVWGRFGGGWNWELGFQLGGSTLIINLLFCSIRISREKKEKRDGESR